MDEVRPAVPLIFTGTSASGKTTLSTWVAKHLALTRLDVITYVDDYITRVGMENFGDSELISCYDMMFNDISKEPCSPRIIEIASDFAHIMLPRLVRLLPVPPLVVYCDCPIEECARRNALRVRPVPERGLAMQSVYDFPLYDLIGRDLDIVVLCVATSGPPDQALMRLRSGLQFAGFPEADELPTNVLEYARV